MTVPKVPLGPATSAAGVGISNVPVNCVADDDDGDFMSFSSEYYESSDYDPHELVRGITRGARGRAARELAISSTRGAAARELAISRNAYLVGNGRAKAGCNRQAGDPGRKQYLRELAIRMDALRKEDQHRPTVEECAGDDQFQMSSIEEKALLSRFNAGISEVEECGSRRNMSYADEVDRLANAVGSTSNSKSLEEGELHFEEIQKLLNSEKSSFEAQYSNGSCSKDPYYLRMFRIYNANLVGFDVPLSFVFPLRPQVLYFYIRYLAKVNTSISSIESRHIPAIMRYCKLTGIEVSPECRVAIRQGFRANRLDPESKKRGGGKASLTIADLRFMQAKCPPGYKDYSFVWSLLLFSLSGAGRASTVARITLKDILQVTDLYKVSCEKHATLGTPVDHSLKGNYRVVIDSRFLKGKAGLNKEQAFFGHINQSDRDTSGISKFSAEHVNFVEVLDQHLFEKFGLRLNNFDEWRNKKDFDEDLNLWDVSKGTMSNKVADLANRCGYSGRMFTMHSCRAGHVCNGTSSILVYKYVCYYYYYNNNNYYYYCYYYYYYYYY